MRIGIDVTFLFDQYSRRGIGYYGRELLNQLLKDPNHTWVLFGFYDLRKNLEELGIKKSNNIEFVSFGNARNSNPFNVLYFRFKYLKKIRSAKLDLYFAPSFERGLPVGHVKTAVMIHDVIPYATKSYSQKNKLINFIKGIFYKRNLEVAKRADLILTNSDFSKREIVNKAGFKQEKVKRIHLGISERFRKDNISDETREIRRVLIMYKITQPYLLYYGGLESNKNIANVLRAFAQISMKHPDHKLVLAGKEFKVGWDNKAHPLTAGAMEVTQLIDDLKLKHKVIITGEVEGHHLPVILRNSVAFIHLSTYEGFGFSVLEASAAGVPVIAARRSSYPEILKETAEFVDPFDKEAIANSIAKLIKDEKHRDSLVKKALENSEKYTWEKTASETLIEFEKMGKEIKPLNIAYVVPYFHPIRGGAENNALALAKHMVRLGHNVTVFTTNTDKGDYPKEEEYEGIIIRRFNKINSQYYFGIYPNMLFALLSHNADIIHAHGFGFIWHDFCLVLKKIVSRRTKFINTPHGPFMALSDYSFSQRLLKAGYTFIQKRFLNRLYSSVIQVNPSQVNWIQNYNISPEKVTYIPNGINKKELDEVDTADLVKEHKLNRKILISFIGRYEKYKGLQDIISALTKIDSKTIKLIAIGNEGAYLNTLKQQVEENKLENKVEILVSPSDDIKDKVLQESKIFILPSDWEAFGISILEAMAKENAIISTRTEGGEFLIKDGKNGYLYDFSDVNELTKLIEKLVSDKKLLANIAKNNKDKAKGFTWEKISQDYYKLLYEITK
ncbi:glycosyltransferase [Candidatus Dojkabacteria bacterium]|uniref:Glycosyltransferase n=1 Tax=Candidatus Dojkabacteria bacterium TaxID=2099670 RepID=A0A955L543_9BACT|nr:glycosyltransferase [Candidatus Dojkabacteria bacterium]